MITVGSFHAGAKHNIISDEAKLQLTVRSYSDESRQLLLDGIRRVARGEAITAGLPETLMPEITVEDPYTPSTFNDPDFSESIAAGFRQRFGDERVMEWPAVMGGEDFSQFRRAAPEDVKSMIFWISGTPQPLLDRLEEDGTPLPSLHSPFWAPDAEKVIATGAEALASAAIRLMPNEVN